MSTSMPMLHYIGSLALVSSKYSTNSLAFTMSLAATQVVSFSWYPCHFTKCFFVFFCLLGLPTLKDVFYLIFQTNDYKVGRWPNHLLAIGPQGDFVKWL